MSGTYTEMGIAPVGCWRAAIRAVHEKAVFCELQRAAAMLAHAELHGVVFAFTMLAVPGRALHTQTFSAWHLLQVTCVASVAAYKLVAAVCAATHKQCRDLVARKKNPDYLS